MTARTAFAVWEHLRVDMKLHLEATSGLSNLYQQSANDQVLEGVPVATLQHIVWYGNYFNLFASTKLSRKMMFSFTVVTGKHKVKQDGEQDEAALWR